MSDESPSQVQVINPPQTLQNKVEKGGPGAVDLEALAKAESVIANLSDDYLDWVKEDLVRLEKAYDLLRSGEGETKKNLDRVFQIAHDMKGQGGSFGFDLMTAIGDQLCRLVEKMETVGPREVTMVRVHIDAMRVVITKNLKGDGGAEGKQLLMGLDLVGGRV